MKYNKSFSVLYIYIQNSKKVPSPALPPGTRSLSLFSSSPVLIFYSPPILYPSSLLSSTILSSPLPAAPLSSSPFLLSSTLRNCSLLSFSLLFYSLLSSCRPRSAHA